MCSSDLLVVIKGLLYWQDSNRYYSQENNPEEEEFKKLGLKSWLQTCGPTAMINILDNMGHDVRIITPGGWKPQPESTLTDFFNDSRNYTKFKEIRPNLNPASLMANMVPQYYPYAIEQLFGVKGLFSWGCTWTTVTKLISEGTGVMICLSEPGHYVAPIAYDAEKNELIYNDPWKGNKWPASQAGKPGYARRMKQAEFEGNTESYRIEVYK